MKKIEWFWQNRDPLANVEVPSGRRSRTMTEVFRGLPRGVAVAQARNFPQSRSQEGACPLGIDIRTFVRHLREGHAGRANQTIRQANPLPSVCGRLCSAPCEKTFGFSEDQSVTGVRVLERFVSDRGQLAMNLVRRRHPQGQRIAVVGSGPAGLTAAATLAQRGYRVVIFEALPFVGGSLRFFTAAFRLPRKILDREIRNIERLGVNIQTNHRIGPGSKLSVLFRQGFSSVMLAVGKGAPRQLRLPGSQLPGVFFAEELLYPLNYAPAIYRRTLPLRLGQRVAVVGNGDLALDCARVCARWGKTTSLIFERTEEDLASLAADRTYAREEGVTFQGMMRLEKILPGRETSGCLLQCVMQDFADPENDGNWKLVTVPDSRCQLEADSVILAGSFRPNSELKRWCPRLKFDPAGYIRCDPETYATSQEGVFAAGLAAGEGAGVLEAMSSGQRAARRLSMMLTSKQE